MKIKTNKLIVLSVLLVGFVLIGAGAFGNRAGAQSTSLGISSLSPSSATVGTTVTVNGSGFTATGNNIHFGIGGIANVSSANGTTLTFTIPSSVGACDLVVSGQICSALAQLVNPGTYQVFVTNANGTSNTVQFTVTGTCPVGAMCVPPQQAVYSLVQGTISAISAADSTGQQTVTVTLSSVAEPTSPCQAIPVGGTLCPGSSPSSVNITWGEVLVIDGSDQIINAISGLKVGDSVVLYERTSPGTPALPYALKDSSENAPCASTNCVGSTGGGTGTGTGGGSTSGGGSTGGGVSVPPVAVSPSVYLGVGSSNSDVLTLQQKLQALGYFPASTQPTGYFGQVTATAVKAYQTAKGLPSTGVYGPLTRSALGL